MPVERVSAAFETFDNATQVKVSPRPLNGDELVSSIDAVDKILAQHSAPLLPADTLSLSDLEKGIFEIIVGRQTHLDKKRSREWRTAVGIPGELLE